jgi:N-acetylglucosaminyl-diphospho-decaprenol L-rhamnosyltransferase
MQGWEIMADSRRSKGSMLDLATIIVNFNTHDYLRNCLTSIYNSRGDFSFDACVVDNASADSSVEMVRAEFPQARLIQSPVNGGYSYANNLGLRAYGFGADSESTYAPGTVSGSSSSHGGFDLPRYVLLLNPDTELPADGLAKMLGFMDERPEAGVAGPKLVLEDGSLDLACRRSFPTPQVALYRMVGLSRLFPRHPQFGRYNLTYLDPDRVAEVDSVVGAFMLVRREAILQAGLLDEAFFMYGEDLDWAYRITQAGWKVYYNPAVTVLHVKRAASRHSPRAEREFYRAMHIFYDKHYAHSTPFWLHWLVQFGISVRAGLLRARQSLSASNGSQQRTMQTRDGE